MLLQCGGDSSKPWTSVFASTGGSAINSNAITIHFGLILSCKVIWLSWNDKVCAELTNKYSEVELVIFYEISMVSRKLPYKIQNRSNEIFSP